MKRVLHKIFRFCRFLGGICRSVCVNSHKYYLKGIFQEESDQLERLVPVAATDDYDIKIVVRKSYESRVTSSQRHK